MLENSKLGYLEMPGGDLPATKAFYTAAFGWTFVDYGPTYAGFGEAGLDGGFQADASDPSAPKVALPIVYADDLEAMLARVVAAGGLITIPIFTFPGGRRFHFRDPAGNDLAVFSER